MGGSEMNTDDTDLFTLLVALGTVGHVLVTTVLPWLFIHGAVLGGM